jgi:type IV secretory pathway VirB6-like protein
VDPRKLIKESWIMLFKIAGVFFFLNQAPAIYADLLSTIQGFADSISGTAVSIVVNSGFCVTAQTTDASTGAGVASGNLWTAWDCLLNYIFGFSGAAALSAGIVSIIVMFLFSKGIGSLIFSVAVYLLLSLIFGAARFVHVYLMAILGLSFIYCFGYIFVPLLLFRGTYDRFEKWMHICIGYMFTPIIMLGFMGMMLVTLDTIWFTGTHSISKAILGASNAPTTPGTDGSDNAFTDAVNKQGNTKTCDLNLLTTFLDSNPKAQSSNAGQTPKNGVDGQQQTSTACGDNSSNNNQANNAANNGQGAGGGEGLLENLGIPGSTYLNNISSTISKLKISVQELDIKKMASAAGSADTGTYTSGVLSAFVTAALIVYIMIALLDYIPTLAADLVASGTSIGGAFRSKMMGEDLLRGKNPGIGSGLAGKIKDMGKS